MVTIPTDWLHAIGNVSHNAIGNVSHITGHGNVAETSLERNVAGTPPEQAWSGKKLRDRAVIGSGKAG